ncbi:hypothetical protein [Streptomyces nojiriensis]|uniref:hypothetical protein n=1 Tax=Streptomyces nojiriensis TaxID=66374 RepID=UPI0036AC2FEA
MDEEGTPVAVYTVGSVPDELRSVRLGREHTVHYSPTLVFNGLSEGAFSSTWSASDWK